MQVGRLYSDPHIYALRVGLCDAHSPHRQACASAICLSPNDCHFLIDSTLVLCASICFISWRRGCYGSRLSGAARTRLQGGVNGRRHAPGARESAPGLRLRPRRGLARAPLPPPLLPIHHLSGITRGVTGGMDTAVRTKPRGRKARAPNCARCAEKTLRLAPAKPAPPALVASRGDSSQGGWAGTCF